MNPTYGTAFWLALGLSLLATVAAAPNSCAKIDLQTDPFACCTIPKLLDVAIVSTCFEKFPIDPAASSGSKVGSIAQTDCMSECILNGTAIYNRRGGLDAKKLTSVFTDSLPKDSPWMPVVRKAIKDCSATSSKKSGEFSRAVAEQRKAAGNGKAVCKPEASFLVDCIHTTVFSKCPTSLRSTATECNAIWQFLKNCPFSALRQ